VGRYVALAPGDLSIRTLAHEFGHVLGFHDGYIRGYRDLGEQGFEIMELTSVFDDIMSAPREGHVQPAHFRLVIESLQSRGVPTPPSVRSGTPPISGGECSQLLVVLAVTAGRRKCPTLAHHSPLLPYTAASPPTASECMPRTGCR